MKRHLVFSFFILVGLLLSPTVLLAEEPAASNTLIITAESGPQAVVEAIVQAQAGDTIEIHGGVYSGPVVVDKPLTLIGHDWPIIDGGGQGSVLHIEETAVGSHITGLIIRGSGRSLDQENSGIVVEAANTSINGNRLEETLFGIYLRQANGSQIRGNEIISQELPLPRRGDAIRVWYSNDVTIANNIIDKGRDVVLWYSERLQVTGNEVSNGRYGLHFMYCDDALIEQNRLLHNSVGAYLMYSRRLVMRHNTVAYNRGPSGYGVGLKDMDDAVIVENLFLDNRIGAFLDNSPREVDGIGRIQGNLFAYNDMGLSLMPSVSHNQISQNSFVENQEQVAIAGGGQMQENWWTVDGVGNYWSNYAGYDAGGNGQGDIPYQADRLFENMVDTNPALRIFLYSPAVNAVDFAAVAFPIFQPQPKLVDDQPLMSPLIPTAAPALPSAASQNWWGTMGLLLFSTVGLVVIALSRSAYGVVRRGVSTMLRTTNYVLRPAKTTKNQSEDTMIEVVNLTKRFGRLTAVNNLSFTVATGEAVALWGANGAGKSTALHCLLDLTQYEGTITVNGLDARRQGKQVRAQVGFVPQMLNFHDDLTILETLDLYTRLKRVESDDEFAALLAKVDLTAHAHKRVDELSGGLKQRLALALALLADPPILLLDEPTASLDVGARAEFLALLRLLKQAGKTLLFSSHHLDTVTDIADRVLVLEGGTLVAAGPPAEMKSAWGLGQRNGQQGYINGQHKDLQLEIVCST